MVGVKDKVVYIFKKRPTPGGWFVERKAKKGEGWVDDRSKVGREVRPSSSLASSTGREEE